LKRGLLGLRQVDGTVKDPWHGWDETVTSAVGEPWFGPNNTGIVWLDFNPSSIERPEGIGVSGLSWIGNHFTRIDGPAPASTKAWWERLRRHMKKATRFVPASGSIDGPDRDRYAFPSALARMKAGVWRDVNLPIPR
jgi:hypothetical protein